MRECLRAAVRMSRRAFQVLLILLLGLSSVCVQPEDAVHLWLGRRPTKHLRSRSRLQLYCSDIIAFPSHSSHKYHDWTVQKLQLLATSLEYDSLQEPHSPPIPILKLLKKVSHPGERVLESLFVLLRGGLHKFLYMLSHTLECAFSLFLPRSRLFVIAAHPGAFSWEGLCSQTEHDRSLFVV